MAGASQRSIWATAPSAGDLAPNGGEIAADNWNPTLTRWGAREKEKTETTTEVEEADEYGGYPRNIVTGEWRAVTFDQSADWSPKYHAYVRRSDEEIAADPKVAPKPRVLKEEEEELDALNEMSEEEFRVTVPFMTKSGDAIKAARICYAPLPKPDVETGPFRPPIVMYVEGVDAIIDRFPKNTTMAAGLRYKCKDLDKINEFRFLVGARALAVSAPGSGQGNVYFSRALTEDVIGEIAKGLEFDSLGRAALPGQLHRFSRETARNAKGEIVTTQLIVRVGRTVTGNVYPFADVVKGGKSILIIARPNMRKTTTLRELVRVVKRFFPNMTVELVDRSSEIGGAGYHGHASLHSEVQRIQLNDRTPGETATIAYRNYSPNFIYDEVADKEEAEALMKARNAGVVVVTTTHDDLQA
ncbi:Uncharacterized protein HDU88_005287 [Geranomyces variabilis]|nr:Uncharacterized protein HDU88_005287 [Geranomyces variabilis]